MDKQMFLLAAGIKETLSRWPFGLRRGSAAARFLELWVQIPPGCMDVSLL